MPIICNNCGQRLPDDAVFCTKCGSKVTPIRCSGCGAVLTADAKFCPSCGTPVGDVTPPVEQVQQTVEVQKAPTEPEIASSKATQSPPSQTAATDALKQAPNRFEWEHSMLSIVRGLGTTKNAIEINETSVTISSRLNKQPIYDAKEVQMKAIDSVEVWEKVSIFYALFGVLIVGFLISLPILFLTRLGTIVQKMGVIGIVFSVLICLVMLGSLGGIFFRMHHWRLTIKTQKEPTYAIYELSARPKDKMLLLQIQSAIMSHAGIPSEPVQKRSKKLVPAIVISVLVLVVAAFIAFQELYQIRALPEKILSDKETRATAWVEMRGDFVPSDCDIIAEVTEGQLAKPTAVPRYEDGSFLYQYVKYIYNVTLSNHAGEIASGTVTATVGFSVKPFHNQPEAIIFDSFTYSDELTDFIAQQRTMADQQTSLAPVTNDWCYDPADMISTTTEEDILAYNAYWNENYQSVTAVAAITDALEGEAVDTYANELAVEWGLSENDMLFLIYNNGKFWQWYPNQTFYNNYEDGFGLQNAWSSFQVGYEDGGIDNALKVFFEELDLYYAAVYMASDPLPISEPLELTYSSGAGAWQTSLTLSRDGSFEGSYYDADMGDRGENYPNGTVYLCNFSGKFTDITQVNDYTYSMTLENGELYVTAEGGEEWIEDGVRYILMRPSGLDWGTNFRFYTPDAPVSKLPVEFLDWWPGRFDETPSDNLSYYGLYNEDEGSGFFTYE